MAAADFIEHDDRWEVRMAGRVIDEISFGSTFRLHLHYEPDTPSQDPVYSPFMIEVEAPFTYVSAAGARHELAESTKEDAPALDMLWMTVREATFIEDGTLTLRFEEGALFEIRAWEEGEAWNIQGPAACRSSAYLGEALRRLAARTANGMWSTLTRRRARRTERGPGRSSRVHLPVAPRRSPPRSCPGRTCLP